MKEKIKEFYHKYDYKINANFILETIIQCILLIIIAMLIFLLGHKEVKALNIPQPNSFDSYNRNGTRTGTYSIASRSNWWWSHTLYTPFNSSVGDIDFNLYNNPRLDFVWSNFKQYCKDYLTIEGSITHSGNFEAIYDTYDIYIINGGTSNLCSKSLDLGNHKVDFNCSIKMNNNAIALSLRYHGVNGLYGQIGLISTSQYSCVLDSSSIINNQNNNTQNIINNNNNNTNQIINNQNQNNDKLIDSIQGDDINTDDIPVRDDETLNKYNKAEEDLLGDDLDIENTIKINSNKNAMSWIWDLITKILNWNEKVFSFIISALSIGLIKLILCR